MRKLKAKGVRVAQEEGEVLEEIRKAKKVSYQVV